MSISGIIDGNLLRRLDLNCAEGILYASNEALGLGLDKQALKLAAGFGGGLGIGHVCGALTGAIMVLGRLYVRERAHESDRIKDIEKKFIRRFEAAHGGVMCTPLKNEWRTPEDGCKGLILRTAELLEEVIAEDPPV